MCGENHAVGTVASDEHGVIHRLDALDDQASRPHRPQPVQVVDRDGGIKDPRDEISDCPLGAGQGGEAQGLGGEQVDPPPRMHGHVRKGLRGELGRDGQAIAHVTVATPRHGRVHGEDDRVVARIARTIDELHAVAAIGHEIELEPPARTRHRSRQLLDRCGAQGREAVRNPHALSDPRYGGLTGRVHHPRESCGREDEWVARALAEDRRRRVDRADITQHARLELHPREGAPGSAQAGLILAGRPIGVVEDRTRHATSSQRAHIGHARAPLEESLGAVEAWPEVSDEWLHVTPARQAPGHQGLPSVRDAS